jgi:2-methylcitrate dehydratase PrpD
VITAAGELAAFLAETRSGSLPPAALERGKMLVASTLASAAAGSSMPSVEILRRLALEDGGRPESKVWFAGGALLPAAAAAGLNASGSDAAASDDSDLRTGAHTGTAVVSAALAAAGRAPDTSGLEALGAIVVGYEAAGRIGAALGDGLRRRGFHPCAIAAFGSAVAAARLLGLDAEQLSKAIDLTAATGGGLLASSETECREYAAGAATARGFRAALSAGAGYRGGHGMLDGPRGMLHVLSDGPDIDALTEGLGESWDIETHLLIKLRPGGYLFTSAVDAVSELVRDERIDPDIVEDVLVSGPSFDPELMSRAATDYASALHSLPYYVATVLVHGELDWKAFSTERIADDRVARLASLVRVERSDHEKLHWAWGARVVLTTTRGSRVSARVDYPTQLDPGGLEWSSLEEKLGVLAGSTAHDSVGVPAMLGAIRSLGSTPVEELLALL